MNYKVSEIAQLIINKYETDSFFRNMSIIGELGKIGISNGHAYFEIKELVGKQEYTLRCVYFNFIYNSYAKSFKQGDKVLLTGGLTFYTKNGYLQIKVNNMEPYGEGLLYKQYLELKKKLEHEGLFDPAHKKDKPKYPERFAVLVGKDSSASHDIEHNFATKWLLAQVDYHYVTVQGNNAAKEIINTLKKVDTMGYEVIILARGGGSFEDLFCFNDEELARTIYSLNTYIVTGIGHESDTSISDLVADKYEATPSNAVTNTVPNRLELLTYINALIKKADYYTKGNFNYFVQEYRNLRSSYVFTNSKLLILKRQNHLNMLNASLNNLNQRYQKISLQLETSINELRYNIDRRLIDSKQEVIAISNEVKRIAANIHKESLWRLDTYRNKSIELLKYRFKDYHSSLDNLEKRIKSCSQERILALGYTLVFKDDKVITNVDDLKINDNIAIKFKQGNLKANIKEVENE